MVLDRQIYDAYRPQKLPAAHPVRKLYKSLPWLESLPTVRMLFRLLMSTYGARLERAAREGLAKDDIDVAAFRRALVFFENIDADVTVDGSTMNLFGLYQASLLKIRETSKNVPWLQEKSLKEFCEAVGIILDSIRLARTSKK